MPIRLSGMVSGMDTESLVTALVSGYKVKKDNLVKAQTKLSWKQEKWKTMNTSIYSFYSGKLSAARMTSAYSLKKASVSNTSIATVTASSTAVSGTQSLKVSQLASSGYLTGGTVSNKTDSTAKITGSSKISDITGSTTGQGSITVAVDGKNTSIELTDDMTVNQLVTKLKSAGVQASFDENNQRFFISSKTSGAAGDFTITADSTEGLTSLQSLGLYTSKVIVNGQETEDTPEKKEYKNWSDYYTEYNSASKDDKANTTLGKLIASAYESQKTDFATVAKEMVDAYNKEASTVSDFEKKYNPATLAATETKYGDNAKAQVEGMIAANKKTMKDDYEDKYITDGKFDESRLTEEQKKKYEELKKSTEALEAELKSYDDATKKKTEYSAYVSISTDADGKETVKALTASDTGAGVDHINDVLDKRNTELKDKITNQYVTKAQNSVDMYNKLSSYAASGGAVRIVGQDAKIELNGAEFTSNTSTFSVNGLTIQATALTTGDEAVTITTDTDVDAIYKSIKDMFSEYNKLIKSMDEAYNADSSKGYEPLTDDEKDAMSDKEVEKWETKIKDSLLRKDSTLSSVINTMKNDMASTYEVNGKSYSLASFGIATLGYFTSGENEKGVYHIDGDKDDTSTSGNDDKLRAAIASDPETVVSFFTQLSSKLYADLGNKMSATSVSSIYTVYNDKQMNTQYSEYNTKISDAETKVTTWEDYYYSKFSAMESALAKLNSQSSSMSGLFGN